MKRINCEQISILLTYFIENRLSSKLMSEIEYHLNTCPQCREKFMNLQRITQNYKEIRNKICETDLPENSLKNNSEYKLFKENLSAYIDNELPDSENLRLKKFTIINPAARQELEDIIHLRNTLQETFERTKSKLKTNYSDNTIEKLYSAEWKRQRNLKFLEIANFSIAISIFTLITILFFAK